jgi:hypothetical protein
MRDERSDAETLAHRRKRHAQDVKEKPARLKETPLLQRFPNITMSLIIARSTSLTTDIDALTAVARTLSREFWQQKNFHDHRPRL